MTGGAAEDVNPKRFEITACSGDPARSRVIFRTFVTSHDGVLDAFRMARREWDMTGCRQVIDCWVIKCHRGKEGSQ